MRRCDRHGIVINLLSCRLPTGDRDKKTVSWQSGLMRQLLLLRHAKSSWDQPGLADHDRPLSNRGHRDAAAMRRAMRDLGLAPDLLLLSDSRRTQETAEALEPWDETPLIEPTPEIYLATAPRLLGVLHGVAETVRSVLLIGHNPGLQELALLLVGPKALEEPEAACKRMVQKYPTAALAEFSIPGPWWGLDAGGGRLVRFLVPRDLPTVA
jgi:phosphohistidine phosphatase